MTAEAISVCHSLVVEDFSNLVGLVAVDAGRQYVKFFFPQLPFDHLPVDFLDLGMALNAGGDDTLSGNGGAGVCMGKNVMGRVTRDASRRYDQSFLE
jgi:hypothetical protein